MKPRKYSIKLLLCGLLVLCVVLTAVACTKGTPTTEITGTVEQTDKGVVIASEEGQYLVADQDLSEMLGMKVKATGKVLETEGRKTIIVESVKKVQ